MIISTSLLKFPPRKSEVGLQNNIIGMHGNQLAIFTSSSVPSKFSVCEHNACMLSFANDESEIVQFKPDVQPSQVQTLWTLVQSNPHFKNHKVLNDSVWQRVSELVQTTNQSDIMKEFRESVRNIIMKRSYINHGRQSHI
jgi:hypothetical protein